MEKVHLSQTARKRDAPGLNVLQHLGDRVDGQADPMKGGWGRKCNEVGSLF